MKRVNIERLISKLITERRNEVINALMLSNIKVYGNITNQDLYDLTMNELKKSNPDLNTHLGDVIDATFDLSPLMENNEPISGADGKPFAETKVGSFLSSNSGALISAGTSLLNTFFGGGGSSSTPTQTTPTTQTGGGGSDSTILLMMQQQQQQAAADAERRRLEDEASRRNTWIIVGVVGGLVVIGGIVAIVLTRK